MDKKTLFKEFVKKNPSLIKYVKSGEMTWQKFYEIFDLYGEDDSAWSDYITKEAAAVTSAASLTDFISWFKQIDLTKMQESIQSVQRVLGVLEDLGSKNETKPEYKPRPLYKHFED